METLTAYKQDIAQEGFALINGIYTPAEVDAIIEVIEAADTSGPAFRKTADLFAIRQFLKQVPEVAPLLFTQKLREVIHALFGSGYFLVKSIYFDKPGASNWFVSYHQDLTISVDRKQPVEGFGPWTVKQDQFSVQPPLPILEDNFTIRVHLDNTDEGNGALRVVPGSHLKGICRPEMAEGQKENPCPVQKGGIMVMRPLLLHASSRTADNRKRRVVHMEFSRQPLPDPLQWSERLEYAAFH